MRNAYDKSKFIETLKEYPFVSFAAKKSGISRATIYRWMKDNPEFKKAMDDASEEGRLQCNDIAEMALMKQVKAGSLPAIKFFLTNNHEKYIPKRSIYVEPPSQNEKKYIIIEGDRVCAQCSNPIPPQPPSP